MARFPGPDIENTSLARAQVRTSTAKSIEGILPSAWELLANHGMTRSTVNPCPMAKVTSVSQWLQNRPAELENARRPGPSGDLARAQ
jgi:hypothetical protein